MKNVAASVRARLANHARETGTPLAAYALALEYGVGVFGMMPSKLLARDST